MEETNNNTSNSNSQRMVTRQKFITHSEYRGTWLEPLHCMDGYGVYTFPDDSQYHGYFAKGHFHGVGTLHLAEPYNFTFSGTFTNGHLVEIDDMWFDDGLNVKADVDGYSIDFRPWLYLTAKDRRYADEHRIGLQAIGPLSKLTAEDPPRVLNNNYYDVGEGIYNPTSGLLTNRPAPFPKTGSIACAQDIEWILKNCRHGPISKTNIDSEICHRIIRNNLESDLEMADHMENCNYDYKTDKIKDYFGVLCATEPSDVAQSTVDNKHSEELIGNCLLVSSSTCRSFSDIDVQQMLFPADKHHHSSSDKKFKEETPKMVKQDVAFEKFNNQ